MLRSAVALVASALVAASASCTTRGHIDDGGRATDANTGGRDAATDACGGPIDPSHIQCASIYAITGRSPPQLYRFDPICLSFELIGTVSCPAINAMGGTDTPFSMAVDRNGVAWVLYTGGQIFNVDVHTAACTATAFVPGQSGFQTFGMGFSSDTPGGTTETLYVSRDGLPYALGRIDTTSLALTPIGPYDSVHARAELTGTGDARLFGAFEGSPFVVAEIDKTSAHILSQAPQTASQAGANFAFASYAGDFYLFVGPGTYTDVVRYRPATGASDRVVMRFPQEIVGAGVSTCAPPM